ncbi:NAD(P)-dependent oxidoreductase [Marinihelvus fidelis]|uniref:NAD(P)-dependent oxidoreductase n=1 Tax=Marinihelvus fidelis TaxID=2613842 RepID=A0A5N0T8M0_9GAMM|nr:NAD(P)-dependent oxidoreductase [Marinihelvus fidelis]KAA9129649.1 NAD(P)-dependent oxidoreductase [Marinihelvus fidelis]
MKALVTGSAGHLGEAMMLGVAEHGWDVAGLDVKPSPHTDFTGSITDRAFVRDCLAGVDVIFHTATLHKPHVGTHSRQDFVDTNVTGTLNLLEEAVAQGCKAFIFTSTTSTFGDALRPAPGEPAVWVTEDLRPRPKNIYGVTKCAAEDLCALFHRNTGLPCLVLKTSRFFPEDDDDKGKRDAFDSDNLKVNELLNRRADIADLVSAHLLAAEKAGAIGFDKLILSAPSPFRRSDAAALATDAPSVLAGYVPKYASTYEQLGWTLPDAFDRVYDSTRAQRVLGWVPRYTFQAALEHLRAGEDYRSELARRVGSKGYHSDQFEDEPFPVGGF